jgi:hypothetical protein
MTLETTTITMWALYNDHTGLFLGKQDQQVALDEALRYPSYESAKFGAPVASREDWTPLEAAITITVRLP